MITVVMEEEEGDMFERHGRRTKDHWVRKEVPRVRVRNALEFLREFVSR